jgi:LysM repeat protein
LVSTGDIGLRRATHKVNPGDTLWSISRQYGVSVADLKARNGMAADVIHTGDTIRLP